MRGNREGQFQARLETGQYDNEAAETGNVSTDEEGMEGEDDEITEAELSRSMEDAQDRPMGSRMGDVLQSTTKATDGDETELEAPTDTEGAPTDAEVPTEAEDAKSSVDSESEEEGAPAPSREEAQSYFAQRGRAKKKEKDTMGPVEKAFVRTVSREMLAADEAPTNPERKEAYMDIVRAYFPLAEKKANRLSPHLLREYIRYTLQKKPSHLKNPKMGMYGVLGGLGKPHGKARSRSRSRK